MSDARLRLGNMEDSVVCNRPDDGTTHTDLHSACIHVYDVVELVEAYTRHPAPQEVD